MDLRSATDELYASPPAEFALRRSALVAAAKAAGNAGLARELGGLRKPVTAAWLVNCLVRANAAELGQLSELGRRLRQAHQALDGVSLRELSTQRQELIGTLISQAADAGGVAVAAAVNSQLQQTFEAAIADADAEAAVLSGQLTTALFYSGFGPVDLSEATAVPVRHLQLVPPPERKAAQKRGPAPKSVANAETRPSAAELARARLAGELARARLAGELAQARIADEQAAAAEQDADRAITAAETALEQAHTAFDGRLEEFEALQEQLRQAQRSLGDADSALVAARQAVEPAQQAAQRARNRKQATAQALSEVAHRSDTASE